MLFFKGILIGIGKILPGVSGSLIAITMKLYEPLLEHISTIFKNPKKSIKFLFPILSGILFSILTFSNILKILINKYYFLILLLFIGLIIGSTEFTFDEFKNKKTQKITLFITILLTTLLINKLSININLENNIFTYILLGLIEILSTIIPGISGTAIFIILKKYELVLEILSNPLNNINILLPFLFGILIGLLSITKLITYIIKKHPNIFKITIKAFQLSTLILMYLKTLQLNKTIKEIFIGQILLLIGIILSKKLNKL